MSRMPRSIAVLIVALGILLVASAAAGASTLVPSPSATAGDFDGLVDIGGRSLYLECHGMGSPTVVLEAGYGNSGGIWSDGSQTAMGRTPVMPGVAAFTHVCAYDRPGTGVSPESEERVGRSDPVAQPRNAPDVVSDLHALLQAAGVPGPYVLAGHSMGGFFVRLYASAYPDDVAGLVLIDSRPDGLFERLRPLLSADQWGALTWLLLTPADEEQTLRFGLEKYDISTFDAVAARAAATTPLRPMPLAVLAEGQAWGVPEAVLGHPPDALDSAFRIAQEQLAALIPNSRFFVAAESGHFIQLDQPVLVTEAIRQVVAGVRNPDTWFSLASCCVK